MLYERWCAVAASRAGEVALRDLPGGRTWTFGELQAAAASWMPAGGGLVYPRGNAPEFLLELLASWRTGRVTCPLEAGQVEPSIPVPPSPIVHLKSTSATTGSARCVAFTAGQLAADAANIVATMGLRPEWPNIGVISLAHSYGFSNLVLPLLLHGIPLILAGLPLPEIVRQAAEHETAVTLAAVPALWRTWHEAGAIPPSVRLAISAGAPLPLALEATVLRERGVKIHNFYGASECGGIAYDANETVRSDPAVVGSAMRNVELGLGEDRCLVIESKAVGETYWPAPDAALGRGRFQTSDLAELDGGTVHLRGRVSDQINLAGRKLDPTTIEHAVQQHPAIAACLAFGVPDDSDTRGEVVVLCYEARLPVAVNELRQFLLDRLEAWQLPRAWWAVDSLPPNVRGKTSRAEWRSKYIQERHNPHTD